MSEVQERAQHLDEQAFMEAVRRALSRAPDVGTAVGRVLKRHRLAPDLEADLLHRGAVDFANDVLMRIPRERILATVAIRRSETEQSEPRRVDVVRSILRDWPVHTAEGVKRLETCTVDEIEQEVSHIDSTIAGLQRRRQPLAAAVKAARDRGLRILGDLPDDVLDACLEEESV